MLKVVFPIRSKITAMTAHPSSRYMVARQILVMRPCTYTEVRYLLGTYISHLLPGPEVHISGSLYPTCRPALVVMEVACFPVSASRSILKIDLDTTSRKVRVARCTSCTPARTGPVARPFPLLPFHLLLWHVQVFASIGLPSLSRPDPRFASALQARLATQSPL